MPHTPSTEHAAAHPHRPLGISFLRPRRAHLAFGAMTVTAFFACLPTLPASADMVEETIVASVEAEPAYVAPPVISPPPLPTPPA